MANKRPITLADHIAFTNMENAIRMAELCELITVAQHAEDGMNLRLTDRGRVCLIKFRVQATYEPVEG